MRWRLPLVALLLVLGARAAAQPVDRALGIGFVVIQP